MGAQRRLDGTATAVPAGEDLACTGGVYPCVQTLKHLTQGQECSGSIHGEALELILLGNQDTNVQNY